RTPAGAPCRQGRSALAASSGLAFRRRPLLVEERLHAHLEPLLLAAGSELEGERLRVPGGGPADVGETAEGDDVPGGVEADELEPSVRDLPVPSGHYPRRHGPIPAQGEAPGKVKLLLRGMERKLGRRRR